MAKIISVNEVLDRLSLPQDSNLIKGITAALGTAKLATEVVIQSKLDAGSISSIYFVNPYDVADGGFYLLKLPHRFIVNATTMVYVSTDPVEIIAGGTDISADCAVVKDKGWVYVPSDYTNHYLRVEADYGFADNEPIPDWVKEVSFVEVIKAWQATQINDDEKTLTELVKSLEQAHRLQIDSNSRSSSLTIAPLRNLL